MQTINDYIDRGENVRELTEEQQAVARRVDQLLDNGLSLQYAVDLLARRSTFCREILVDADFRNWLLY